MASVDRRLSILRLLNCLGVSYSVGVIISLFLTNVFHCCPQLYGATECRLPILVGIYVVGSILVNLTFFTVMARRNRAVPPTNRHSTAADWWNSAELVDSTWIDDVTIVPSAASVWSTRITTVSSLVVVSAPPTSDISSLFSSGPQLAVRWAVGIWDPIWPDSTSRSILPPSSSTSSLSLWSDFYSSTTWPLANCCCWLNSRLAWWAPLDPQLFSSPNCYQSQPAGRWCNWPEGRLFQTISLRCHNGFKRYSGPTGCSTSSSQRTSPTSNIAESLPISSGFRWRRFRPAKTNHNGLLILKTCLTALITL